MDEDTRCPLGAGGMGTGPRRSRGLNPGSTAGGGALGPGLARLVGAAPLLALTAGEASVVLELLDQSAALAALSDREVDPVAARLADRLRSELSARAE
ncbi:hypothetical protein [Nocardiopsis dassonvillei]|uniref:hypothetical protein n=1 Tax=Nocardiopsis dassonvillei TaxID=2014 RepID=UPI003672D9E3